MIGRIRNAAIYLMAALSAIAGAIAYLYRHQRDSARDKAKSQRRRADTAEARLEQRDKANQADKAGRDGTEEIRDKARQRAKSGKRDHFEDQW